jgi:hypothetical protein
MPSPRNLMKCRYCDWTTLRFRGKRHGEYRLRKHVLLCHEDAYLAAQGLDGETDDRPWTLDTEDIGERAL